MEVIDLIRQIANENPLWGVPRIHGELIKLGINVSQSTVQRYMPKRNGRSTGQRWPKSVQAYFYYLFYLEYWDLFQAA
ncbi:MAG: IS3 family transposase [Bacteroidota bacterium]|nr:IS3 family transposase [Bacteroidota bacterium]MDP4197132.1 IS3 family transposase [Bacteroidota bacterium]